MPAMGAGVPEFDSPPKTRQRCAHSSARPVATLSAVLLNAEGKWRRAFTWTQSRASKEGSRTVKHEEALRLREG